MACQNNTAKYKLLTISEVLKSVEKRANEKVWKTVEQVWNYSTLPLHITRGNHFCVSRRVLPPLYISS